MSNGIVLECNWQNVLTYANSSNGILNAKKQNRNITDLNFPLTRNYLNNYYSSTNFENLKKSYKPYDCAAAMYSYWLMSYGHGTTGTGQNPYGGAAGALPSTGFNPYGAFDWNVLPNWLWLALLIAGGLFVYDKIK